MSFQLSLQFLKSDMQRIDNAKYFMKNFQFDDLQNFLTSIATHKQINDKKQSINLFYDRFLSMNLNQRSFYVQLKWIVVLHQIIQKFKDDTPLYGYTLKALQICLDNVIKIEKTTGPYQKYLIHELVKPYIQYLSKLCLLHMPQQIAKYDKNSALNFVSARQPQSQPYQISEIQYQQNQDSTKPQHQPQQQNLTTIKLIDWYRKYNFISSTLQTFEIILADTYRYFNYSFPYLTNISRYINQDLNSFIFKLKYMYRSLKKLNVTIIELDQLQNKLKIFINKCIHYEDHNIFETSSKIEQYQKKDLQQFLQSPLKPCQIKLFKKKSVVTPTGLFINN